MNVRVTLGRLTHLRRLLSHFVPGHPSIRRSSAFAGYQRRGRGRQSRACGTRHSCLYELSVRRRRASALCSPWHDYVHPGMAAWLHGCMARGRLFARDGAFRVSIGHHEARARRIRATGSLRDGFPGHRVAGGSIRARCDPSVSVSGICRDSSATSASDADLRVNQDLATCRLRPSFACDDVLPLKEGRLVTTCPIAPEQLILPLQLGKDASHLKLSHRRITRKGLRLPRKSPPCTQADKGRTQDSRDESTQLSPRELQK